MRQPNLWDQASGRIQPIKDQLQGGRELSSWGAGGLFESAGSRLQFDNDHEIIALKGNITQTTNDQNQPAIASPVEGGSTIRLLTMMEQGCYLRVAQGSGFPCVIVRDSSDNDWHGNTQALPGYYAKQLIVDTAGVWCPPCKYPVIMPPTARYIGGFQGAQASWPIGGSYTDDAGQTYTDATIAWYVYLEASLFPFTSGAHPTIYSGFFKAQVLTTTVDLTLYLPAMPMKWSNPRNGIKDYRGCISMNAPSAMNNADMQFIGYDHDVTNDLSGMATGETDLSFIHQDIPQYVTTAYWFQLQFLLDDVDADNGDIPANTHFQVEL